MSNFLADLGLKNVISNQISHFVRILTFAYHITSLVVYRNINMRFPVRSIPAHGIGCCVKEQKPAQFVENSKLAG